MRPRLLSLSSTGLRPERWFPLLFLMALTVSSIGLTQVPSTDELYTVLAAQGWAATGAPVLAEGVYERAELYTALIGVLFRIFGDSLLVARLLSVFTAALLVLAVFLWTRYVAGTLAAWSAALLLCLSPLHIHISQFARFYALFALVFWLGAIGVYALAESALPRGKALLIGLGSAVLLWFALHLQPLAQIGFASLVLWLLYARGWPWLAARREHGRWLFPGLLVLGAAVLIALVTTGVAADLWEQYRWSPVWNRAHRNEFWFYHVFFNQGFQSLWPLFPFLAIFAVAGRPKPALFCFLVFCTALVLLSFGGMKDRRYVYFLLPFLSVLWGIALAELIPFLRRQVGPRTLQALHNVSPRLASFRGQRVVIALGLLFLIGANGAPMKTLFGLAGINLFAEGSGAGMTTGAMRSDWAAARPQLMPWLENADVVVTTHDVQALYFLGRSDFVVNNNRLSEIGTGEFGIDRRTGLPVVTTPASIDMIIDCRPNGLILAEARTWRTAEAVPEPTADLIEARTVPIPLPERFEVLAFRWQHPQDWSRPACPTLP